MSAPTTSIDNLRWPLQPLLDATGLSRTALARRLNVAFGTVHRAGREGVSDRVADRWAIRLGLHPLAVWGWDWVTAGLPDDEQLDEGAA